MDEGQSGSARFRREVVRRRYGRLFDEVTEILFRHDPVGINLGDNTDEYEPEAGTILPRLEEASSLEEALDIVHQEFVLWFDPAIAGPKSVYEPVAADLWSAWLRHEA